MNVLSLFDGISCGRVALERAGIKVDNYFASEIDKYAIKVSKKNWPDIIHLGTVENWQQWTLPKIDLIIGGSPCQGFSFAGKQLNFEDPRSKLFWTFVDIVNHYKPTYWMLENVKMKQQYQDIISSALKVEPIEINSALVSAQNRRRLYWANFPITQPIDKGILLKDIIEDGEVDRDKSYALDASYYKGGSEKTLKRLYFEKSRRQIVLGGAIRGRYEEDGSTSQRLEIQDTEKANALTTVQKDSLLIRVGSAGDIKGHDYNKRVYSTDGKAPALAAASGGNLEPKIAINPASMVGRRLDNDGKRQDYSDIPAIQYLEVHEGEKSRCLSTVQKDTLLSTLPEGRYDSNNLQQGLHYRKLTPIECERLQTLPDNYTNCVSNTQRYRALGNGWTVDVIAHIFTDLKNTQ